MKLSILFLTVLGLCLISSIAYASSIGGSVIGSQVSMHGIPEVSAQTVTANEIYVNGAPLSGQYLKIDQGGTAQTVVAGRPIFDQGIAFDDSTHYFIPSDGDTLKLYIASTLVHTWHVTLSASYALLETGDTMLLETGDKIILE